MRYVQSLNFEISRDCNLREAHAAKCPIVLPDRYGALDTTRPITDELILHCIACAYAAGFRGLIGWHFYNEPMVSWARIRPLMEWIRAAKPEARFLLWTNGTLLPDDLSELAGFAQIVLTDYAAREWTEEDQQRIAAATPTTTWTIVRAYLDDRAAEPRHSGPERCLKPFREMVVDYYGNAHLCCSDFRGHVALGNVWDEPFFATIAERFTAIRDLIKIEPMPASAPEFCRNCGHRQGTLGNVLDEAIHAETTAMLEAEKPRRPKVFLAMPLYGRQVDMMAAQVFLQNATRRQLFDLTGACRNGTLPTRNFNNLFSRALNEPAVTHFAMLHGDCTPEDYWLDTLFEELERTGADMIAAVVPIKDERGITSTAIDDPNWFWSPKRRLTMAEIYQSLPETFSIEDCRAAGLAGPDDRLLCNTGCWLCDLRKPWAREVDEAGRLFCHFTVKDAILKLPNGRFKEAVAPEDWNFSRMLAMKGAAVYATRKVGLDHIGEFAFTNKKPWGSVAHDVTDPNSQEDGDE